MPIDLPIELVRSFVAIVDCGSMQKASTRVFVTPSALSLQMKRLEMLLGAPVFERTKRGVQPTPTGLVFVDHARALLAANDRAISAMAGGIQAPLRIGMLPEFVEPLLTEVLPDFLRANPGIEFEVTTGKSAVLAEMIGRGELDLSLRASFTGKESIRLGTPIMWFGDPLLARREILPLVVQEEPCAYRETILSALRKMGRPYKIVVQSSNLASLRAAVRSGIGITAHSRLFADPSTRALAGLLPALPSITYSIEARADASLYAHELAESVKRTLQSHVAQDVPQIVNSVADKTRMQIANSTAFPGLLGMVPETVMPHAGRAEMSSY